MRHTSFSFRSHPTIQWLVPILSGVALLMGAALCWAAPITSLTDSQKVFVERYVQALQDRDFEKYKPLIHPKCLACYSKDNEDFHRDTFQRRLWPTHWPKVQDIRAKLNQTLPQSTPLAKEQELGCPVRPTHVIQLDFSAGEFKGKSILVNVALDNGSWFEVFGCPSPETLQKFRVAKMQKDAEVARAETLFSSLKDPLLSDLKALLKQGKKVTAIGKYRDASGEELSTAKRVIELLEKELLEK